MPAFALDLAAWLGGWTDVVYLIAAVLFILGIWYYHIRAQVVGVALARMAEWFFQQLSDEAEWRRLGLAEELETVETLPPRHHFRERFIKSHT